MKKNILAVFTTTLLLSGCDHCTKGGRWSPYYFSADPRCTYFCADPEEKYCANSPIAAEQLQLKDLPNVQNKSAHQLDSDIIEGKKVCAKLGFKPETEAMANCLLSQQQMKSFQRTESDFRNQQAARAAEAETLQRANDFSNGFRNGVQNFRSFGRNQMTCTPNVMGTSLNCQ